MGGILGLWGHGPVNSHLRRQINRRPGASWTVLTSPHERPNPSSSSAPASSAPRPPAPCSAPAMPSPCSTAPSPAGPPPTAMRASSPSTTCCRWPGPSTLKRVPQMLMDRNGPLTVHPPSLPWLLPWMARFARAAYSPAEVQQGRGCLRAADGRGQHRLEGRDPGVGPGRALQEPAARSMSTRARPRSPPAPRSARCRRPRARSSRSSTATAPASWRRASVDPHRARRLLSARHAHHQSLPVVATLAERFAADGGTILRGRVRGFGRDGNQVDARVQLTDQRRCRPRPW